MSKSVKVTPHQSDINVITYIFSYFKTHGIMPSGQEVGDQFRFTRQGAYNRFNRFVQFKVLRKAGRGDYRINAVSKMPSVFAGVHKVFFPKVKK